MYIKIKKKYVKSKKCVKEKLKRCIQESLS